MFFLYFCHKIEHKTEDMPQSDATNCCQGIRIYDRRGQHTGTDYLFIYGRHEKNLSGVWTQRYITKCGMAYYQRSYRTGTMDGWRGGAGRRQADIHMGDIVYEQRHEDGNHSEGKGREIHPLQMGRRHQSRRLLRTEDWGWRDYQRLHPGDYRLCRRRRHGKSEGHLGRKRADASPEHGNLTLQTTSCRIYTPRTHILYIYLCI